MTETNGYLPALSERSGGLARLSEHRLSSKKGGSSVPAGARGQVL
jgi:hypothetical protein